jgi:D-alanyl-D-alanine carboxypeptidase
MRNKIIFSVVMLLLFGTILIFSRHKQNLDNRIEDILKLHAATYQKQEYFSGIALSVLVPGQQIKNYYAGYESHDKSAKKISENTLFEIGSITKSFIAAVMLQLEKENRLHMTDTIKKWLPEYEKWSDLKIESLLNMSTGLPNYTDAPLMNAEQFLDPAKKWAPAELIKFVYPAGTFTPPLRSGYYYTNTGYILAGMIIEKASGNSVQAEVESRLISAAKLRNTFYPVPDIDSQVFARLAEGYSYNPYDNPELLGRKIKPFDLSWAGAAGAGISTPADIIKWVHALFIENNILDQQQKQQLTSLVSTTSGKPITSTSTSDQRGFGLGVVQVYDDNIGKFWFYEGETTGFRALYVYVPETGIIISAAFNSAVNNENDHSGELIRAVYKIAKHGVK